MSPKHIKSTQNHTCDIVNQYSKQKLYLIMEKTHNLIKKEFCRTCNMQKFKSQNQHFFRKSL